MTNKIRQIIGGKQAEMRILKLEEATINKIAAKVKDQLNRLKIEAMAFNNGILDRNVKNAIQSTSSEKDTPVPSVSLQQCSSGVEVQQTASFDQPQQINMVDLDLLVPPSASIRSSYTYNEESSDEDEEANECLLQL